ncbi:glycosyltransferase [Gammaproteobacteria bacterium]|nr:glycosyltransferase [Gammaproteobacteria bacterium]
MRVLHIISGLGDGGAEAILYRLCKFDKQNNHVVISLMGEQKYGPMLSEIGIDVYTLNNSSKKIKVFSIITLYKLINKLKPDVVQTWMYHADFIGGVIARLAGIKNIIWGVHHTTLIRGKSKPLTLLIAKINAFLSYFIPKKIIYCAEMSRKTQESIGFKKNVGVVIPNGYDVDDYKPNENLGLKFRNEMKISNNKFVIGHVGRFDPQKDQNTLILSFAYLKKRHFDFNAVVIGTNLDNKNKKLLGLIKDKDLSDCVYLLGRRNDIPSVMNGIDLFVLSSAFGEAFPNVLNEAMACGTPCIATDIGDSRLIIGDTGWTTPIKDHIVIANAIIKAAEEKFSNKDSWLGREKACRERIVENFSIQKMVKKYKDIWEIH